MTRDEYLKLAQKYIAFADNGYDGNSNCKLAHATLAQAALMMVAQMDRDAAKPPPEDTDDWQAEDPRR